jgi:tyrosyl-tRNA synthetase
MSAHKSELLRLLDERGYIHQVTDAAGLDDAMLTLNRKA